NTLFYYIGRLTSFLNYYIIVYLPSLTQDYVFIIIPKNWDFFAKSSRNTILTISLIATLAK
ncbi:hypothetical protein P154DRAFT_445011, partial [Amniculicola lignicola CBS 123094]